MPAPGNNPAPGDCPYVSRGGLKLEAALDAFGPDVAGLTCADLGCSTGGFTDCLLQRGAAHVYSVDTAYGELAWKLRNDDRVTVLERTNATRFDPYHPETAGLKAKPPVQDIFRGFTGVSLVVLDLGWTKQDKAIPAALRWLRNDLPDDPAYIITLIKPHYESGQHRISDDEADTITQRVIGEILPPLGVRTLGVIRSPIHGGKGGNLEHLALLRRA